MSWEYAKDSATLSHLVFVGRPSSGSVMFHDAKVKTRAMCVQLLQTTGLSHVLLVAMLGECWISSKFTEKKPKK